MQSETGFPSSHQLKSYVAYKSRLKLAARAVLSGCQRMLAFLYLSLYTVSQKTSHIWLALTLIHVNGF